MAEVVTGFKAELFNVLQVPIEPSATTRGYINTDPLSFINARKRLLESAFRDNDEEQALSLANDIAWVVGSEKALNYCLTVFEKAVAKELKNPTRV